MNLTTEHYLLTLYGLDIANPINESTLPVGLFNVKPYTRNKGTQFSVGWVPYVMILVSAIHSRKHETDRFLKPFLRR